MKTAKVVVSIVAAAFCWFVYWLFLPTLSLAYFSGFAYFAFCALVLAALISWWCYDNHDNSYMVFVVTCIVVVVIAIIGGLGSTPIFNSGAMREQLGKVSEKNFEDVILPIDNSQIPTVDQALANKQGVKKLGQDPALGSVVELGYFTEQQVNGKLVYVAALEHTGFLKWNTNRTTPGYITVSASNSSDVQYVTELDGKPIKIAYQKSACFGNDLKRHIRNSGFRTVGLSDGGYDSLELDDSGRPYWVITTYRNTTWWANKEATGVITCDAQTGECKWYSTEETPKWVDTIQPVAFIEDQINNWGAYVHGPFNWSRKDELKKTDDMITVYCNGVCYFYTGMTSVGADDAVVGFMMVNSRTKEATMFYMAGATEEAAMGSAQGAVQQYNYIATEPVPLNSNGIPTYFMTLKDAEGLVKKYALVNISNYSLVATGDTIADTKKAYMQVLSSQGNTLVFSSDEAYTYTKTGPVSRISPSVENGNTYYYLIVNSDMSKIFMASYSTSDELPITREGDEVSVKYVTDNNGLIDIVAFDNLSFGTEISEDQKNKDELNAGTNPLESESGGPTLVDEQANQSWWDSLSEEEKANLLKDSQKDK